MSGTVARFEIFPGEPIRRSKLVRSDQGYLSAVIEPGMRADLVAWDPDADFEVDPRRLHQRQRATPYAGRILTGVIDRTWVAGHLAYAGGTVVGEPRGRILEQI